MTSITITPEITVCSPWRLTHVKPLSNYCLDVTFIDGTQGFVKMRDFIMSPRAGVFSVLKDTQLFDQVFLEYGAVTWPGDIDLSPDTMHKEIKKSGEWILKG